MIGLASIPFGFLGALLGMGIAITNPGHVFNNGTGVQGCQLQSKHQGWQRQGWHGGQWSRPRCVKNGQVVWCDEVCKK
jgi:hypothetical protein